MARNEVIERKKAKLLNKVNNDETFSESCLSSESDDKQLSLITLTG